MIIAIAATYKLVFDGILKENEKNFYTDSDKNSSSMISFEKKEEAFSHLHRLNFPFPKGEEDYYNSSIIFNAIPSGTATLDLNNDGFVDFCFSLPEYKNPIHCYLNNKDNTFSDVTDLYGLTFETKDLASAIYAADFNNDGLDDLLLVKYGQHDIFLRNGNKFLKVENDWFSNAWGANFYDFNGDGLLDIIFANYYRNIDLKKNKIPWSFKGIFNNQDGAPNELYQNLGNGHFKKIENFFPIKENELTTAIGIADYDKDGHVDVFVSDDYSIDHLYTFDNKNHKLIEQTNSRLPLKKHGYSGMNANFFDINNDGFLDLFVSNIVLPPLMGTSNLLWIWNPEQQIFEQKSKDYNVNKCGYAWTAKDADFDNDGSLEIIVASGFYANKQGRFNTIFNRLIEANTPGWFPAKKPEIDINTYSEVSVSRPCLFTNNNDRFEDVSKSVLNWDVNVASRSLVVADINNDGLMDVIINQQGAKSILYINSTKTKNDWVGLSFKNKNGGLINFGVRASLLTKQGKLIKYFELNPANGFKTQHDYRYVTGLGTNSGKELVLKIDYPVKKEFKIRENMYNELSIN